MRILLTGARGFIGSRFLLLLKRQGVESILALGRHPVDADRGVENIILPDLTLESVGAALKDKRFDGVVHLAAAGVHPADRNPETLTAINSVLPGSLVSIAASCGSRAFVMAGSSAEYRQLAEPRGLREDDPLETSKLYGATKAAGGILALAHGATAGIGVGVLRLFNAFGPGEAPHRLLPALFRHLSSGNRVPLSPGAQIRDFVYVDDICAALWAALEALAEQRMPSGAYNVATGRECSVADFSRLVARSLGMGEEMLDFGAMPMRPDDLPYLVGDSSALEKHCGWKPAWTLERGIDEAVAALKRKG
ncbi:MAG: NAD(P)-dependent oxidoreductase [Alphaproteobacteria bacterium]